jgi:LmbE family N-acetylglucosaminyl deacetylase
VPPTLSRKHHKLSPRRRQLLGRLFLFTCGALLLATSIFWALLSAGLQNNNADQLVDGYLFESRDVFRAASFPGAHSFLIKWPLFALSAALGNTTTAVTVLTVICALLPIATLATLLIIIERRKAVLGLWFLALSSMLLLVPAQPGPGVLLPVNTAMFTTRNLEYTVFIVIIGLLVRSSGWRAIKLWVAAVLATLLIASDGIFAPLLVGSTGLLVGLHWLRVKCNIRRTLRSRPLQWFSISLLATGGALLLTKALVWQNVTGISSAGGPSPYAFVTNAQQVLQAIAYAALGLLTLFGANPAYDYPALAGWPQAALNGLHGLNSLAYIANFSLLMIIIGLSITFMWQHRKRQVKLTAVVTTAMLLLLSSVVAAVIYVATNHYYPVDPRYLSIWFYALILAAAIALRPIVLKPKQLLAAALLLLALLPLAIGGSYTQYNKSHLALQPQVAFQQAVATQIAEYHIDTLVGNYWDVVPIRQATHNKVTVVPLSDCITPQTPLASRVWQRARSSDIVAYLINTAPPATGFPKCNVEQHSKYLGEPTRSITINSPGHPQSQLLLYDRGVQKLVVKAPNKLVTGPCSQGSLMQIVAHEDDDLLFMNPDLQTAISAGKCITTVFITAGEAGSSLEYAHARRMGSQVAYATMYQKPNVWTSSQQVIHEQEVTISRLQSVPQVSLVYLNLPDGNVTGRGFKAREYASLARLRAGKIDSIQAIEGQATYTADDLEAMLLRLMNLYRPDEIRTQNFNDNQHDGDHSDHHAAGYFAANAFRVYGGAAELKAYMGYTGRLQPANVTGIDLAAKESAFFAYASFDGGVCASEAACNNGTAYGTYLPRQYSKTIGLHVISSYRTPPPAPPIAPKPHSTEKTCVIGGTPHFIDCAPRT